MREGGNNMSTAVFDPTSEEYHADPGAALARARETGPLHWVDSVNCWFAVTYDLVKELYTHPSFTNDQRTWVNYTAPAPGTVAAWTSETSLFARTGDEHARQRRLASAAFTPAAVKRQRERIAQVCDEYAGRLDTAPGATIDVAGGYTRPIPNTVISRVLGVPPLGDDETRFRELAALPLRLANPMLDAEERLAANAAAEELIAYVRTLIDARRAAPADDLVSDLVESYDNNDQLTDDEVVLIVYALLAAGTDTTTIASTYGLRSLLRNKDQLALLHEDPDLLPNAMMELLRYELGGGALPRYAMEDCEVGGRDVHRGDLVFLSPLGAHRDPAKFDAPDTLDITRDTSDVVVFGHGPHYCLGANLAKGELEAIYRRALEFLHPDAELLEDEVTWTPRSVMFNSIATMPVRV